MENITSAAIGSTLEQAARRVVPVIAAVFTAGYLLGLAVHHLNDLLAGRQPVAALPPAPAPIALLPQPVPVPAPVPVPLESLTCRELRELIGVRKKLSKRQLIAMAVTRGVAA
jgi:hypothetical protein